jgi:hypothetical protein
MATTIRIPKLTDREVVASLARVVRSLADGLSFEIRLSVPHVGDISLDKEKPEKTSAAEFVFVEETQAASNIRLFDQRGQHVVTVERIPAEISDRVTFHDNWIQTTQEHSKLYVRLVSLVRAELKSSDLEAALAGTSDSEWSRFRKAQMEVLKSLQNANETLIIRVAENNAKLDQERSDRYAALEEKLHKELADERAKFEAELEAARGKLNEREAGLDEREKAFNTKESRYVGRQKQDEQVNQVQEWLKDWKLTAGTSAKRRPVFWAYVAALALTGGFSIATIVHNFKILDSAQAISMLVWWQWVLILLKTLVPVGAFTTFMVYFIRWTNAWARQHADEEFRNRTRLIDIGRSSWLLEAVRDAQETGKDLPPELIKELSRNLFSVEAGASGDLDPQAFSDLLLQGLSSLRIKSPDGSEIEAQRGKPK